MAFSINEYLRRQSIRLQREDWGDNAQLLGDEMFTIMRNIQLLPEDPTDTDDNGNPITVPDLIPLPELDGPGDFDPVVNPADPPRVINPVVTPGGDPDDPNNDDNTTVTQTFWHRSSHPGKLTSEGDGSGNFSCDMYYNGLLQPARAITAKLTDADLEDEVESGQWVTVFLIVQYEATGEVSSGGQQLPTVLTAVTTEYLFNSPGPAAGGKIGVVTTQIEGGTASAPGEGMVLTKKLVNGSWVDADEASTVYSTVTGTVKLNKDVQLKRVSGRLFVDVEDCGGEEDEDA